MVPGNKREARHRQTGVKPSEPGGVDLRRPAPILPPECRTSHGASRGPFLPDRGNPTVRRPAAAACPVIKTAASSSVISGSPAYLLTTKVPDPPLPRRRQKNRAPCREGRWNAARGHPGTTPRPVITPARPPRPCPGSGLLSARGLKETRGDAPRPDGAL
ncbi:hypothetical protein SKAU_G00380860 [Synaphobranchus kaupii]|uniref:Uncharacterized protein n=1 Tax=Synaphobranchus kaupii TaxID=118154 RepID=A0A9Q1EDM4_SYNKA|nr:hypothetical protein SKAU_G00380860 [Synaphobranchus kaupii]